jgi:hypothetical protein
MTPAQHSETLEAFDQSGYAIVNLLSDDELDGLEQALVMRVRDIADLEMPPGLSPFSLADYHGLGIPDEVHARMMAPKHRYLPLATVHQGMFFRECVMEILEHFFGHRRIAMRFLVNATWRDGVCGFRVVRAAAQDVSGIHSESSYGICPITLWLPVVGFDERFTLNLAPGSHAASHPAEAIQASPQHMAKPYAQEYVKRFTFLRPRMQRGQALVFHPNLLHGGSANCGPSTRVSMDIRFFREGDPVYRQAPA